MIKLISLFDQLSSAYEAEDDVSVDSHDEIRPILVYIGLITIILVVLLVIYSLINKCRKMFNDETISTKKIKKQHRRNPFINRQTSTSSVSSSLFLINYQSSQRSLLPTKQLSPIVYV